MANNCVSSHVHDQDDLTKVCLCKGVNLEDLKKLFGSVVREEAEGVIRRMVLPHLPSLQISSLPSTSRSSGELAELPISRVLHLRIVGNLPKTLSTRINIQDQGAELTVELCDSSGFRVEVGPECCAKIRIVPLDGDFEGKGRDNWTHEEFNKMIVLPRKDRSPVLAGDYEIYLIKGAAVISNISFTDNSSSVRNGKFRLGAQVMKGIPPGTYIREAVSERFRVKELRPEQKHGIPALEDELWRLVGIGKKGTIHQRLAAANVHTVKDFLQLYYTDTKRLQKITDVSGKSWLEIVENAEKCILNNDRYIYTDETTGVQLLLDCVFKIVHASFMGQNTQVYADGYNTLKDMELADKVRKMAYENRSTLQCVPTNQAVLQPLSANPTTIPSTNMQCIDSMATITNQGEQMALVNNYSSCHQPLTSCYEDNNQPFGTEDLEFLNSVLLDNGTSTDDNITSKLKAVCYVTKAAILFMVKIDCHDSSAPTKKRKL